MRVCAQLFLTHVNAAVCNVCCENVLCWWQRDEVDPMSVFEAEEQQLLLQRQPGSFGSCGLHDAVSRWVSELWSPLRLWFLRLVLKQAKR